MTDDLRSKVEWGREFSASIVVFLVALPLCMGIAIASGVPPALGLVSGIIGGLVVGMIGGAPLQVSGPAAGLAVLVWQFVDELGLGALGIVVVGAGLLQVVSGWLKFGRWFRAVSPAVIQGMLAGIGVLIFASQFHVMVDDSPKSSGWLNLLTIPSALMKGILPLDGSVHHLAAFVGLVSIVSILVWNKYRPAALKAIPGPLVAVVLATILAGVMRLPIQYVSIPENLLSSFNFPEWGNREIWMNPKLWGAVLGFAVIASAETLLCATAVDRMHDGPRTQYDRELLAQGVGNMLCGVLGALPITGVIVRSSANLEAGAKTKYSAVMHGAWILLFVALLPFVIRLVPTASLAAILVYTGFKLVNPAAIRKLWEVGRGEVVIYASTLVAIVATDLLTGVLVGFGLALMRLLYTLTHLEIVKQVSADGARIDIGLRGAATFIQLPKIAELLESLDEKAEVHFHLGSLAYVDHAILETITEWHQRRGGKVSLEMDALRARANGRLVLPEIQTLPNSGGAPGFSVGSV